MDVSVLNAALLNGPILNAALVDMALIDTALVDAARPLSWAVVAGIIPWLGLGFFLAFGVREPRKLEGEAGARPRSVSDPDPSFPPVTIVVPARNEARNIVRCLTSLTALDYPDFQVVVVDDRSEDGTGDLARSVPMGNARGVLVVEGTPLPDGWFGKPWACQTGARAARPPAPGSLLLFTDADTEHAPELLRNCVTSMRADHAQVLSLLGRQELGTFAERLVQPQIFVLIGTRFRGLNRVVEPARWHEAIANGQYVLVEQAIYDAIGGHAAVRGEVVEDLRLAQELTRAGAHLTVRRTEGLSTRMYTSFTELVNGWTKNVAVGAEQAAVGWGRLAIPAIVAFLLLFWVLPAVVLGAGVLQWALEWGADPMALGEAAQAHAPGSDPLGAGLSGLFGSGWMIWAAVAYGCGVAIWSGAYARFGVFPGMGFLHPLGALIVAGIAVRSRVRGTRRIEWKGRRYGSGDAPTSGPVTPPT